MRGFEQVPDAGIAEYVRKHREAMEKQGTDRARNGVVAVALAGCAELAAAAMPRFMSTRRSTHRPITKKSPVLRMAMRWLPPVACLRQVDQGDKLSCA
jgi:hypothetical protein